MINAGRKRLRRTIMFLGAQKPGLIKNPYIYRPGSIMLDLKDTVAKDQKDTAGFSLYHALRAIDYRERERVVRINGLGIPYWKEDIRCTVADGCDAIRIPKMERPEDVRTMEGRIGAAEKEFGIPRGRTLITAATGSARGVMKTLNIYEASEWFFDITLSDEGYTKDLRTHTTGTGIELMGTRQNMIIATRAAGVQCFDTIYTNLDDMEGFRRGVETIHLMGFDGKSIINPRQVTIVHETFTSTPKGIILAEKMVKGIDNKKAREIGVFMIDGEMTGITFYDGARKIVALARASGVYKGDL